MPSYGIPSHARRRAAFPSFDGGRRALRGADRAAARAGFRDRRAGAEGEPLRPARAAGRHVEGPALGDRLQVREVRGHDARRTTSACRWARPARSRPWPTWSRSSWPARPSAAPACTTPTRSSARTSASGDVVVVEKAGKIIPHVVRVEEHRAEGRAAEVRISPRSAPSAARKLVKDEGGVYIRCPNPAVPGPGQGADPLLRQPQRDGHRRAGRQAGRSTGQPEAGRRATAISTG